MKFHQCVTGTCSPASLGITVILDDLHLTIYDKNQCLVPTQVVCPVCGEAESRGSGFSAGDWSSATDLQLMFAFILTLTKIFSSNLSKCFSCPHHTLTVFYLPFPCHLSLTIPYSCHAQILQKARIWKTLALNVIWGFAEFSRVCYERRLLHECCFVIIAVYLNTVSDPNEIRAKLSFCVCLVSFSCLLPGLEK